MEDRKIARLPAMVGPANGSASKPGTRTRSVTSTDECRPEWQLRIVEALCDLPVPHIPVHPRSSVHVQQFLSWQRKIGQENGGQENSTFACNCWSCKRIRESARNS